MKNRQKKKLKLIKIKLSTQTVKAITIPVRVGAKALN